MILNVDKLFFFNLLILQIYRYTNKRHFTSYN